MIQKYILMMKIYPEENLFDGTAAVIVHFCACISACFSQLDYDVASVLLEVCQEGAQEKLNSLNWI